MHCEGAAGFGIVARAACPVTCQRSGRPEQRENKKQLAPWDTRAPSPERTQSRNNGRRSHSRRPHDRSGNRAGLLHGGLLRLHSKKRKMFEHPPQSSRPAFGIARAAIIESESAFHNDVGWSTASSPAIRAWLKRLALATEPSTPWKSGASAPRWQRSVLGFQPCTGPEGHLSCAPECGPKRAALSRIVFAVARGRCHPGYWSRPGLMSRLVWVGHPLRLRSFVWGQPKMTTHF